jgi:hypothetical protein
MYMGVVHGWHTIWHMMYLVDVFFMILYSLLTYLFLHDVWYDMSLMHGQVQGSSYKELLIYVLIEQKNIEVVAYCSYCKEYRGRHTHRGSHSSSHDSRRRYLSDAYLEKEIYTWRKSTHE